MKHNSHSEASYNKRLALMIGNSRLHWGLFIDTTLDSTWDSNYLSDADMQKIGEREGNIPLILASVVPEQTAKWQSYANVELISLKQIPLTGMYPTLGIDRALAVFGAGKIYGFPILVIDGGTALTFTGVDQNQHLIGGAILPGLGLQFSSLRQKTAELPLLEIREVQELPPRFALDTKEAIQSGIIYTLLAGIKDFIDNWLSLFPESKVVITGGSGKFLKTYLEQCFSEIGERLILEKDLIFWGMREIRR